MFKHILIATDGSSAAKRAATAGIALATRLGAKVTAFSAVEALPALAFESYALDQKTIKEFETHAHEVGARRVGAIGKLAKAAGVPFTALVAKAAIPYEGIIDAAKKHKCDVILMGSHGRRGVSRLLMGSVTQKVLAHTALPVFVFR